MNKKGGRRSSRGYFKVLLHFLALIKIKKYLTSMKCFLRLLDIVPGAYKLYAAYMLEKIK
jgi:hypothetical protein